MQRGQGLPGQHQRRGAVAVFARDLPRLAYLVGIRRAQGDQVGDRAQRGHLFDRLVGWAVFAYADAVVGED